MSDIFALRTNRAAWASFILGLLSLACALWSVIEDEPVLVFAALSLVPPTLVLGFLSQTRLQLRGSRLASWGMGASILALPCSLLSSLLDNARAAAVQSGSTCKLKQIALAMHNYADDHELRFPPPAIYSKDGQSLLSWRVLLLPYLDQQEVYNRFNFDEPWDSPNNIELLKEMPSVYRRPNWSARADGYKTIYQVFVGPGTIFGSKQIPSLPEVSYADGVSNTVLVVEAFEPVPWTKPEDLLYAGDQPLPPLGGLYHNLGWRPFGGEVRYKYGFQAAFADAHVQKFPRFGPYFAESNIRALVTWNGGERVQLP